jgi:hypothetical protein
MITTSAIAGSVGWLSGILLGSAAFVVGVMAVAVFGFLMLSGRVDWRHGARIILGCFIIFSAPAIARGILSGAEMGGGGGSDYTSASSSVSATAPQYDAPSTPKSICWVCRTD